MLPVQIGNHSIQESQVLDNNGPQVLLNFQPQPQGFADTLPQPPPPLLLQIEPGLSESFFLCGRLIRVFRSCCTNTENVQDIQEYLRAQ